MSGGIERLSSRNGGQVNVHVDGWLAAALQELAYISDSPPTMLAKLLAEPDVALALRKAITRRKLAHKRTKADALWREHSQLQDELAALEAQMAADAEAKAAA